MKARMDEMKARMDDQDARIGHLESASVVLHKRNLRVLSREVLGRALQQAQNDPVAQGTKCTRFRTQFGKNAGGLRAAALACEFEETNVKEFAEMCDRVITVCDRSARPQPLKVLREELKDAYTLLANTGPVADALALALPEEARIIRAAACNSNWWALG